MHRILEPELMDDERQAAAYAQADFAESNQRFVDGLAQDYPDYLRTAVDIGCGPGDVAIRLARAAPQAAITAIDGSAPMIALARDAVRAAVLESHITLLQQRIPGSSLPDHAYTVVLSKDLLHHLPDPAVLWAEAARLGRAGGLVYVMDLMRPDTPAAAQEIVDAVSPNEPAILREDFYNSLCAAFTPDEVREQLAGAGLDLEVTTVSDRHMLIAGRL